MTRPDCRTIYFLICLIAVVSLSSVRSSPVYGKLDFLLVDGRPWWPSWRPMIEQVIRDGKEPILSDSTTSTVLRGVFAQNAVLFRFDPRFTRLNVAKLMDLNKGHVELLPVGALYLLLHGGEASEAGREGIPGILQNGLASAVEQGKRAKKRHPYRCVINLHGFTPSWVSAETRHWPRKLADTSFLYDFNGSRGKDMIELLREYPPENCIVYF